MNSFDNPSSTLFSHTVKPGGRLCLALSGFLLFFLMLFVPTAYDPIKGVLLFVVLVGIVIYSFRYRTLGLHPSVLKWTAIMIATGVFFVGWGYLNGGSLRVGTVYVLWPFVYAMLIAGAANKAVLEYFPKVLVFALIAIGLYSLSYILYASGWLPGWLYIALDQGQAITTDPDMFEYKLYSIPSLLFLVPFSVAAIVLWHGEKLFLFWCYVGFALGITLVFLSGRRVLWLITAISPLIVLAFWLFLAPSLRLSARATGKRILSILLITLGVYGAMHSILGLNPTSQLAYFSMGFQFAAPSTTAPSAPDVMAPVESDPSASLRKEQFHDLLRGWQENPLFGAGHGTAAPGNLRSQEIPWAYELSYMALLFHTGLVGLLIYSTAVGWVFWMGLKILRSGHRHGVCLFPILVGSAAFLIANATNPYLAKFDYLWVIFLPVAFINHWLLTREKRMQSTAALPNGKE